MELGTVVLAGISFIIILAFLATGVWIFVVLGLTALVCMAFLGGNMALLPYIPFTSANSFILVAIATFVFMGEIMFRSGASEILFRGSSALFRRLPGGLCHAVILASGIFGATSGSSIAGCATIGRVALPELDKRGYNRVLSLGAIAGGSTLANLIPPSIALILYGAVVQESITRLFMATLIPGIIAMLMMMAYSGTLVILRRRYAPPVDIGRYGWKESIRSVIDLLPIFALIMVVLGSIYTGWATPTEAGALGAIIALVLAAVYRKLRWKLVWDSALSTVTITCMVMILIVTATMIGSFYRVIGLPGTLQDLVVAANLSRVVVLVGVAIFYLVMGLFVDTIPVMLFSLGTIYPLMTGLGYDGIWLGVIICFLAMTGMITPPVGLLLYTAQGISPDISLASVSKGCIAYVVILIVILVPLTIWPQLALWLPTKLMG